MNDFFNLLKQHLIQINLNEASQIIFCADNGPGIWSRTDKLIKDLKLHTASGLPTGSGSIESAIRRVINLRVKGAGMFWKRQNAENIIFLRSLVLTGKLKNTYRKTCSIVRNMFNKNLLSLKKSHAYNFFYFCL